MTEIYRKKFKSKDIEIEVESHDQNYVDAEFDKLKKEFSTEVVQSGPSQSVDQEKSVASDIKKMSMYEFVRAVKPKTGPEYAVTIGYFLEKVEKLESFTSSDIKRGFKMVKFNHSNPTDTIGKAKQTGKLMESDERNTFVLTYTGEQWIEERLGNQ